MNTRIYEQDKATADFAKGVYNDVNNRAKPQSQRRIATYTSKTRRVSDDRRECTMKYTTKAECKSTQYCDVF